MPEISLPRRKPCASSALQVNELRSSAPALSPARAHALRSLFDATRVWRSADGCELRLFPSHAGRESFWLDSDAGRVAVSFDAPSTATNADGELQWRDYLGRSRALAWALDHESRLVMLAEALGTALLPCIDGAEPAVVTEAEASLLWLRFELTTAVPAATKLGRIGLPVDKVAHFLERAVRTNAPLPSSFRGVTWSCDLAWKGPALTMQRLRGLHAGDVIVLGRASAVPCFASVAGQLWRLRGGDAGHWLIEQRHPFNAISRDTAMTQQIDTVSDTSPDLQTQAFDLPVQVDFALAGAELGLNELAELKPGYVFLLPLPASGSNVSIRANGRRVGRGEVVVVGETLGVRLLGWD